MHRRPSQERAERRRILLRRFFVGARTLSIDKGQRPIYGLKYAGPGCLAGLIDREGFLLGVAVVKKMVPDAMELLSPYSFVDHVAAVRVGKLRIDPLTGTELGGS